MGSRLKPTMQLTSAECGLVCCHMIFRYYGGKESMTTLRSEFETGRDGLTLRGMLNVLESRGFEGHAYRADLEVLEEIEGPFIAFVDDAHYVVVDSIAKDRVLFADPNNGRNRIPLDDFAERYSGTIVTAERTDGFDPARNVSKNPWLTVIRHLRRARLQMIGLFLISIITYAFALATPIFTERLINDNISQELSGTSTTLLIIIIGVALSYFLALVVRSLLSARTVVNLSRSMMNKTFGTLINLPYKYFSSRSAGELIYRLNGISMVRDFLATRLVTGIFDIGSLIFFVGFMINRSLPLTGVALSFVAAMVALLWFTRNNIQEAIQQEQSASARANGAQLEAISSIESVKLSGNEQRFFDRWSEEYETSLDRVNKRLVTQGWINSAVQVIQFVGPLTVLAVGLYMAGRGQISVGSVVALQGLSATFFATVSALFQSYTQFVQSDALLDRIRDIDEAEADNWPEDGVQKDIEGDITLENVEFQYSDTAPTVLHGISFDVPPGSKLAIVGKSGSGKSTLAKVLCGLYEPTNGHVRIDGVDVRGYDRTTLYRQIAAVPQDVKLQNLSIADNIRLAHPDATDAEVEQAARKAQVHEDIERMALGYNTPVSEMGMNISGGQRQRLAIARTMVGSPRILVYDEATSSLDLINEAKVTAELMQMDCTRVVIAHRLSTIVDADRVVVLDEGRAVEIGTHDELMELGGTYRELFERQAQLQAVDASDYL